MLELKHISKRFEEHLIIDEMCIRDRLIAFGLLATAFFKMIGVVIMLITIALALVVMFVGSGPVSYTHLDVYKRQILKFTDLCHQGEVPETVREHYAMLSHHASECIECQLCMPRCPFEVNIIEKMKMAQKLFGY